MHIYEIVVEAITQIHSVDIFSFQRKCYFPVCNSNGGNITDGHNGKLIDSSSCCYPILVQTNIFVELRKICGHCVIASCDHTNQYQRSEPLYTPVHDS